MGTTYVVVCSACSYDRPLKLGSGFMQFDLGDALIQLRGKNRERMREVQAQSVVMEVEQGYELLSCANCKLLFDRYQVRVEHKPSGSAVPKRDRTHYNCTVCRGQLVDVIANDKSVGEEQQIHEAVQTSNCWNCGKNTLNIDVDYVIRWD